MNAISIRQPWAWLVVEGFKPVENRTWYSTYRGHLYIHASSACEQKEFDSAVRLAETIDEALAQRLRLMVYHNLFKFGGVIGSVLMVDCVSNGSLRAKSPWYVGPYGHIYEKPLALPFDQCRGDKGIFQYEPYCPRPCLPILL